MAEEWKHDLCSSNSEMTATRQLKGLENRAFSTGLRIDLLPSMHWYNAVEKEDQ